MLLPVLHVTCFNVSRAQWWVRMASCAVRVQFEPRDFNTTPLGRRLRRRLQARGSPSDKPGDPQWWMDNLGSAIG